MKRILNFWLCLLADSATVASVTRRYRYKTLEIPQEKPLAATLSAATVPPIFLLLTLTSVQAQFSGDLAPTYLGDQTATVTFTTPDSNATAKGIPSWFQAVQRTSFPVSGTNLHKITVRWTYSANWSPDRLTEARSATITAGPYVATIEQPGIDNTYAYSMSAISTDHLGKTIELRIYGNVRSSQFDMQGDATWFRLTSSSMLDALILNVTPDDPQYGIRAFYSVIGINTNANYGHDAITQSRQATLRVGAPGNLNKSIVIQQAGIDNTYQVTPPPPLPGGGGDALVDIEAAVHRSYYTHVSSSPWLSALRSRTSPDILYTRGSNPPRYFDQFTVRAVSQGNDKSRWYEPRTGTILILNKPYAIDQGSAGARFESVSANADSLVAISYELGDQYPENFVSLQYSLDGVNYQTIPPQSCPNSTGRLGAGVAPGRHSLVWDASHVTTLLLEEEEEVTLRVTATGGWFATSAPFTLQPDCRCTDCPPGSVKAEVTSSIRVEVPLGTDSLGRSLGRLWIHETTATAALGTPAVLWRQALHGALTFPANSSTPTQFLTPAILAEVSDPDPNDKTWSLKFYDRASQLGPFNSSSGTFTQSGATPYQEITFSLSQAPNRFIQSFHVAETGAFGDRSHSFPWKPNAVSVCFWELKQSGPGPELPPAASRMESIAESVSPDGRTRTKDLRITNLDGVLAGRAVFTIDSYDFGTLPTRIEQYIVQPDGSTTGSRSHFFAYQTEAGKPGYGRLSETYTNYDASWTGHRYNESGRSAILRPYGSAGRGSPDSELDVTLIKKENADFGLGPLDDRARIVTRSLAGEVVSRTVSISFQDLFTDTLRDGTTPFSYREKWTIRVLDHSVTTVEGALESPASLITKRRIYADGDFEGETQSIQFPDGTMSIFEYKAGETVQWTGLPSPTRRSILEGIRETETSNAYGHVVAYQAVAIPENLVLAEQAVLEQDQLGRATKIRHIDGSLSLRQYSCCGLISETGRDGITTSYLRDHLGRVLSSTRLGTTTDYELSPLGRVLSLTQTGGLLSIQRATRVSDSLGIDQRSTTPGNRTTRTVQSHDSDGQRTITVTHPDGGTIFRKSFPDGRLRSLSGTATVPRRYEYGVENNQAFRKEIRLGNNGEDLGWVQTFTDMAGRVSKVVRSHERGAPAVSTYHYNAKGQLIRTEDPDGLTLLFSYNYLGERTVTAVDLNRNHVIDFSGPDRVLLTDRTWSTRSGKSTRKSVTKSSPTNGSETSEDLFVTEDAVDGLETWQTAAGLSSHERTILEGHGNRTITRTTPDGTQEVLQITEGRLASITQLSATGGQISRQEFSYDPLGRLISSTDARTGATTFAWDDNDQLVNFTEPGSRRTWFTYDAAGRPDLTTLPDGGIVNQDWTPLGLLLRQSGARTYPIEFAYDSQGRRTSLTTAAGITRWSYYPESGRLAEKRHPDNRGLSFSYTAAGRLAQRTSARGIVTAYSYDNGGQVSLIDYSDATPDLSYQRDRLGQITSVAMSSGMTTSFAYADNLSGAVESESVTGGPLAGITIDPAYDGIRRRNQLTVTGPGTSPWSYAQSYGYDPAGRLSTIATAEQTFAYGYVANSDLLGTTVSRTNGQPILTTTRTWDTQDRLSSIASTATGSAASWNQGHAYRHNAANLRDRITREDGSHRDIGYDNFGQVTEVTSHNELDEVVPGEDFRYTYNAIGNRTASKPGWAGNESITYTSATGDGTQYSSVTHPGLALVTGQANPSATITIDGQPVTDRQGNHFAQEISLENASGPAARLLTISATGPGPTGTTTETETREAFVPAAVVTPEYDFDGNLTFDGWLEYTWDAENRLQTIQPRTGLSPPGSGSALRHFRQTFTYDHAGRRIRRQTWVTHNQKEVPAADDLFVYDGWNQVAVLNADTKQPRQTYTWGLDLSQSLQGAGGVGGLLKLTDAATGTSHFPAYDGNGNLTALVDSTTGALTATYDYDPFGNLLQATGPFADQNPWRFSTKPADDFTGHYYYGYRHYDPAQGRWLSRDPLGEAGGVNLYGFVGNDGVGGVDVLGLLDLRIAENIENNVYPFTGYMDRYRAASFGREEYPFQNLVYLHLGLDAAAGTLEERLNREDDRLKRQAYEALKRQTLRDALIEDVNNPTCGEQFLYSFFHDFGGFGTVALYEGYHWKDLYSQTQLTEFEARFRAGSGMAEIAGTGLAAAEIARPLGSALRSGFQGCICRPKRLPGPELPDYHAKNFTAGRYVNRQLNGDEIRYKYHGIDNRLGRTHNYVTDRMYATEAELRESLAILDEWGIRIDRVTTFRPGRGTWISEGTAAKQTGLSGEVKIGGDYQGLIDIKNLPNSTVIRTNLLHW